MKDITHIHFIGIGGSSMNGLAMIMQSQGHTVTGSDLVQTAFTQALEDSGIVISYEQRPENIADPDMVVYTAAISPDNPELLSARERGIPTIERADFLGKITEEYTHVVGVAGCHGKTTVTSMIAKIMMQQSCSPTVHIGGNVPFLTGGTHLGTRDLFITEACEYVNSFHRFHLTTAVINNIDDDHLDFFKSMDNIYKSFETFAGKLPQDGCLIANVDDPLVKKIADGVGCRVVTYALDSDAQFVAKNILPNKDGSIEFDVYHSGGLAGHGHLPIPGRHNVANALSAIVTCYDQGVPVAQSLSMLSGYELTARRFEYYGSKNGASIFHDYAHHPTEIGATIATARSLPHEKIKVVFQCHTYTRALHLMDKYAAILSSVDEVLLPDIYAAREPDTGQVHARDIARAINAAGGNATYFESFEAIDDYLGEHLHENDLLLLLGAGDIGSRGRVFAKKRA